MGLWGRDSVFVGRQGRLGGCASIDVLKCNAFWIRISHEDKSPERWSKRNRFHENTADLETNARHRQAYRQTDGQTLRYLYIQSHAQIKFKRMTDYLTD